LAETLIETVTRWPWRCPGRTLSAGFFEHPPTYRHDQATGFEGGNEVIGLDHPSGRVTPAKQRLDAGKGPEDRSKVGW
jgi:hypothetical protein